MIGAKRISELWGNHTLDIGITKDCLDIKITENATGRNFIGLYSIENLPNKIKNTYDSL
jgi:hypothetical protein